MKKGKPFRIFKLFTDGASRGNPGPSGIGAALFSPDGTLHARLSSPLGHQTNNVAEYQACLQGLQLAHALHITHIRVFTDSQLLVEQLHGRFSVHNRRLQPLHAAVNGLRRQFQQCDVCHVPRGANAVADALANVGVTDVEARVMVMGGMTAEVLRRFAALRSMNGKGS